MKKNTGALLLCLFSLTDTLANSQHPGMGGWWVSKSTDPVTLEQVYRAELDGLVQNKVRNPQANTIKLIVRCQNKKPQLLINWRKFLGDDEVTVSHAIDGEPSETSSWVIVGEKTTTSLTDSTALFVQRILDGKKLEVQVKPYRGLPINAVFQLDGAKNALADISKDCH